MAKFNFKSSKGILLKNTFMLYILQFSTYLLALLVAPYQSRVLGAEVYGGVLEASAAIIIYFQLIIDFGFLLSATEEVSRERNDASVLSRIMTSVTWCKIILAALSFVALIVLCQVIPAWKQKEVFLYLTFAATFLNSMMPDYLYRGLESMTAITVRTVIIKVFFTVAMLIFLKTPEQVWVVPLLNIIGNGVAMIAAYFHVNKQFRIRFIAVKTKDIFGEMWRSSTFFFSRIATTAYTALNTIILDIITQSGAATGYYTSANKLITAGKNGLSPIADSLYPYMTKHRDFKLVKKVLFIIEPVIIVFCAVVFIFAEPLCSWFFGSEFAQAGNVLRAMLPIGVITLPNYILGFPMLTAMGIAKHANYSTIVGSVFHIAVLGILFFTSNLGMMTLAVSVSVTEAVILTYRVVVIIKNKHLISKTEVSDGNN